MLKAYTEFEAKYSISYTKCFLLNIKLHVAQVIDTLSSSKCAGTHVELWMPPQLQWEPLEGRGGWLGP
jgi:hypothetical protein